MSIIDSLKKLIGIKTDEVVVAAKEKVEEFVPAPVAEEVMPVVEEKIEEVAQVVEEKVNDVLDQVTNTMGDIGEMVEDTAPKTDDTIMGDNQ